MINRSNWKLCREYLVYREEVEQISKSSLRQEDGRIQFLLEWAGAETFEKAPQIRPTFPEYVTKARQDGQSGLLARAYVDKVIWTAHHFFKWVITRHKVYGKVNQVWLDTLKTPRMTVEYKEHEAVTLEEVRAMAQAEVTTLREKRVQAAAVFWFLSGIRIGAFVTLPVLAVDLDNLTVKQWPKLGVHTKFGKHATTYLLDIPDLLEVVKDWDKRIKTVLPDNNFWFAPISPDTGGLDPKITGVGRCRDAGARQDLVNWLKAVDLPYHSPHKFRHGHAVYGIKNAKDITALKAISQNLMHSDLSITDGVYGVLSGTDVKSQIANLGKNAPSENLDDISEMKKMMSRILASLEK